jgi:phospholipid-binding lipoprotein MlaA
MCSTDSFQEQLSLSSVDPSEETAPDAAPREEVALVAAAESPVAQVEIELAQQAIADREGHIEEYDPWEPFNDKTFWFNRQFDRYLLKPVATGWDWVVPAVVQESLKNALTNVGVVRRVVNNVLQGNLPGAGREVGRFLINSTLGIAGFFDVAKSAFDIEKSDRDTGQTLGVYGVGQGPYLIVPLLPPLTVRDGVGFVVDVALDPLVYFAPVAALGGRTGATVINDRSLNLELYENVEETTLDLYSAVRNAYLQRRAKAIRDARPTIQRPPASAELSSELRLASD